MSLLVIRGFYHHNSNLDHIGCYLDHLQDKMYPVLFLLKMQVEISLIIRKL